MSDRDQSPTVFLVRMGFAIRGTLVALCLLLAAVGETDRPAVAALLGLSALAFVSLRLPPTGPVAHLLRAAETCLAATAVVLGEGPSSPLLLYAVAPSFAGGISAGYASGAAPAALTIVVYGAAAFSGAPGLAELGPETVLQWSLMPLAAGLVAGRLHGQLVQTSAAAHTRGYQEAYRLLAQLRTVARRLPVGLDPGTIATGVLENLRRVIPYEAGAVLVRTGSSSLVTTAAIGSPAAAWNANLKAEGPLSEAWLTQQPQTARRRDGALAPVVHQVVLPLRAGARTFGVVLLERSEPTAAAALTTAQKTIDAVAVSLDTALLFDEVRGFAVAEERQRLAREIHDGVAQEVASLGYLVDNLRNATQEVSTRTGLAELRTELSRIVSELRLSIFDLRSEVITHGGLGAALSEYVRSVGAQSSQVVHLELDETGERMPAQTEAELLRLAQEAIQNARKHSGGDNIWVRCSVRPPQARLLVEDDGVGLRGGRRDGGYGMEIMKERADRLQARLTVTARHPRGTVVDVHVGVDREPVLGRTGATGP